MGARQGKLAGEASAGRSFPACIPQAAGLMASSHAEEEVEYTLMITSGVSLYMPIPQRGPTGHASGTWRVADRIFEGRVRIMAKGELATVRFENVQTGELFAACPIPLGRRNACVEPAADSSRNFVVRLASVDEKTGKEVNHVFVGLNFPERSQAFDFSSALQDHEKRCRRESQFANTTAERQGGDSETMEQPVEEPNRFALGEGQTIRVNSKLLRRGGEGGGGTTEASLASLAPPTLAPPPVLAPPPQPPPQQPAAPTTTVPAPPATTTSSSFFASFGGEDDKGETGWATFD